MRTTMLAFTTLIALAGCRDTEPTVDETIEATEATEQAETVADEATIADWDLDGDAEISVDELRTAITDDRAEDWDEDGNGELSDLELRAGMFDFWDTDGDETIDTVEFNRGAALWFPSPDAYGPMTDWDPDGDDLIVEAEFEEHLAGTDWYATFDPDESGAVAPGEVVTVIHEQWDTDGDGVVEVSEVTIEE